MPLWPGAPAPVQSVANLRGVISAPSLADELDNYLPGTWVKALDVDYRELDAANWETSPPAELDGVAVTVQVTPNPQSLGIVEGVGLRMVNSSSTGVLYINVATEAIIQAAFGRSARATDRIAVEIQLAAGEQPYATNYSKSGVRLAGPAGAYAESSIGKTLSSGTSHGVSHNASGIVTASETLANNDQRSVCVVMLGPDKTAHFNSPNELPDGRPLDDITSLTNNPCVVFHHLSSSKTVLRNSLAPNVTGRIAGMYIVSDVSGTDTITIERFRIWASQ